MICQALLLSVVAATEPTFAIETELVQPWLPEVGIIRLRGTHTIVGSAQAAHGDLLIGAFIRPHISHDIVHRIDEYLLTLGYRQYIWRGLHVEGEVALGNTAGRNRFDGRYYSTFTILIAANAGYRFDLFAIASGAHPPTLYVAPQVGVLHGLMTDIGPRNGKTDTFVQGNLLLGIAF